MANAVKRISVMRGHDVSGYTLQCFGGAGGQHAALVADVLGMTRVFIHPLAGVLSAYGMGLADQIAMREAARGARIESARVLKRGAALAARLLDEAAAELRAQGLAGERPQAPGARSRSLSGHRYGAALRAAAASCRGRRRVAGARGIRAQLSASV